MNDDPHLDAIDELRRMERQTNRLLWLAWATNVVIALGATFVWGHWYSGIGNWTVVGMFAWFYWLNRRYGFRFSLARRT